MSDTPTPDEIDGGAAVEVPAEWGGMTDDEKNDAVDAMLTDVAERAGIEGTADDEPAEEPTPEPAVRTFTDPDSVTE